MGADFYIRTLLVVVYSNGQKDYIEIESTKGYFASTCDSYDSDSEGAKSRAKLEYENKKKNELNSYSQSKLLYDNGKWLISSEDKITFYEQHILESQIEDEKWQRHSWELM